jgi:hypothetical protein
MQNKIIIPTIIAFAIILTGIVALAQYNSNKVVSNLNSSSSSAVSSGSSLVVSSVVTMSSAPTIASSSTISSLSTNQPQLATCNLPESDNLVKTEDGCFEIAYWLDGGGLFKGDCVGKCSDETLKNQLFKSQDNIKILNKIAENYYKLIKNEIVTKNPVVIIPSSKKIDDGFELNVVTRDFEYFKQFDQQTNDNNSFGLRKYAKYLLYMNSQNSLEFKLISIE